MDLVQFLVYYRLISPTFFDVWRNSVLVHVQCIRRSVITISDKDFPEHAICCLSILRRRSWALLVLSSDAYLSKSV